MTKKQLQKRGPKPKPEGEKKVTRRVSIKAKHLKQADIELAKIQLKYGNWDS